MPPTRLFNFDGLAGPTHGYGGLSPGNLASDRHRGDVANPREAALQGLAKMALVARLGGAQAVLPPQPRPDIDFLRAVGFVGSEARILDRARREAPELLRRASSASAMWTANAATVCPSSDAGDARLHLVVANLSTLAHRALEARTTERVLRAIFADEEHFVVHGPLPRGEAFSDEGAANHTRLQTSSGLVHLFGWGKPGLESRSQFPTTDGKWPRVHPARQGEEASRAVARLCHLDGKHSLFWQQSARGIDAGAFHTDVLAVGEGALLLLHEQAFVNTPALVGELRERLGDEFFVVVASDDELPVASAVDDYPFNSQLVERDDGKLILLAPSESERSTRASAFLERATQEAPMIEDLVYTDVGASMNNGGGPACLRLRVRLGELDPSKLAGNVLYDDELGRTLAAFIGRHYRDRLALDDLADPHLLDETRRALDELTQLLELGSVYDFQRTPS